MQLDAYTVDVFVAVTALSAGVMYLLETLLRRESRAGQIWVMAYLCGILTVTAYVIWNSVEEPLMAIAIGNGALVGTIGCLWLGCRRHNGRRLWLQSALVGAGALAASAATFLDGPEAGDWAGSAVLFAIVAVGAALGAAESRRGRSGQTATTVGMTVALGIAAVYYGVRCIVFVAEGPESELFRTWFGTSHTGVLVVILLIVTLVTTTTLRNNTVVLGDGVSELNLARDGVLTERSFTVAVQRILEVEREDPRTLGVIAFRADDLPQIGVAFGSGEQEAVLALCRRSLRRYAPATSPVGECGATGFTLAVEGDTPSDVRRIASRIQRRMLDDLAERGTAVIPVIGVGIAMAGSYGEDARTLIRAAFEAAERAATSFDTSVMIAD